MPRQAAGEGSRQRGRRRRHVRGWGGAWACAVESTVPFFQEQQSGEGDEKADFQGISMISENTKSIPILVRPLLIALNCQKMAESNRKCLRLREWFVQEEIARAIDTALETIIGLSKRKQFKYHRGEALFALDFHTVRHTSIWKSPFLYTWGLRRLRIASLSSESLKLGRNTWFLALEIVVTASGGELHLFVDSSSSR